jgi:RNA polymerase sigma-70 factor (family 1)
MGIGTGRIRLSGSDRAEKILIFILMIPSSLSEDKELFSQIAMGDEQAFAQLFYRYLPRLQSFVRDIVKTQGLTEEMIQDTFLRIWLHRDQLPEIDNPRAWIYKIAAHHCFNHLSRQARERKIFKELAHAAAADDPTSNRELNLRELRTVVADAVQRLPERRRLIYTMSRNEGLSIPEIAERLGLSTNTVKNTLVHSLRFIRERLERSGWVMPALILSWLL